MTTNHGDVPSFRGPPDSGDTGGGDSDGDISGRKESRRQLMRYVRHDMRSPVTTIQALAGAMLDEPDPQPDRVEYWGRALLQEAERLEGLIEDVLVMSALDKDVAAATVADVDVAELYSELEPFLLREATRLGVSVDVDAPPPGTSVAADRRHLDRLLRNVLGWSLSHVPRRGALDARFDVRGGELVLTTVDGGAPVGAEELARIYDCVAPPRRALRNPLVLGLGLHVGRLVADVYGWPMRVRSDADSGVEIQVAFPLSAPQS